VFIHAVQGQPGGLEIPSSNLGAPIEESPAMELPELYPNAGESGSPRLFISLPDAGRAVVVGSA
jgi:hypothetical protein